MRCAPLRLTISLPFRDINLHLSLVFEIALTAYKIDYHMNFYGVFLTSYRPDSSKQSSSSSSHPHPCVKAFQKMKMEQKNTCLEDKTHQFLCLASHYQDELKPAEVPNNPTTELDLTLFTRTEATTKIATKAICAPVIDSCVVSVLTPSFGMLT